MKKYNGTVDSYFLNELPQEAKDKSYKMYLESYDFFAQESAYVNTLDKFCYYFDVSCYDWTVDAYHHSFRCRVKNENVEGLLGIRLATFVWNNYSQYIQTGKYYSIMSKSLDSSESTAKKFKSRYSKVIKSMQGCPLTGVCYDYDILEPIYDCLTYKRFFRSYDELIKECLDRFFKAFSSEYAWELSMEGFEEICRGLEYDIDGNMFNLPAGFQNIA
ncbi:hypothetical protein LJB89_03700 [Tyzzerella sp. OttesenSCG-928-J15]|nr:hypothetical protein [Tyzzerella sp. OttesenSCG-928-J15]